MVTIEYLIRPEDADDFIAAMTRLRDIRQRNGAMMWNLFNDMTRPGIMEKARAFHQGSSPPKVNRLLSAIGHRRIFE